MIKRHYLVSYGIEIGIWELRDNVNEFEIQKNDDQEESIGMEFEKAI
jgi:hypothetical protein